MSTQAKPSPWRLAAYALPIVILAALVTTYLVSPTFYLTYVLELRHREYQIVENANFTSALVAFVLLAWAAWRWWRRPADIGATLLHQRGAAMLVTVVMLGTLFVAGEEVNWGQTFMHWGIPENERDTVETNFHNNVSLINAQGLGTIGLCAIFFVLPITYARRGHTGLPSTLEPAIPGGPAIFCMGVAMAWRAVKRLYLLLVGKSPDDRFYHEFIEQINEQKELLIAVALLLYAIQQVAGARKGADT